MELNELVYKILKEIEQGKAPTFASMGIEKADFHEALEQIVDDQLATNITFSRGGRGNAILVAFTNNSELTKRGIEFIEHFKK